MITILIGVSHVKELIVFVKMKKYIIVTATAGDDAGSVESITEISDEKLKAIMPVIEAIRNSKIDFNWCRGEFCSTDEKPDNQYADILNRHQILLFQSFVPCIYPMGTESVDSIEIFEVGKEHKLL